MAEDDLVIKLSLSDVLSQECPPAQSHSLIASCFHQVNFVRVSLELQEHGHVVKVRRRESTSDLAHCLVASEEQDVAGIGLRLELLLTHIVEAPRLLEPMGTLLFLVACALLDLGGQALHPPLCGFLVLRLELELTVQPFNFYLKLQWILRVREEIYLEVVKVQYAIWIRLFLVFLI